MTFDDTLNLVGRDMTFDDTLYLLGRDTTSGAFTPIIEMTSPFTSPLHSHMWHLWRTFSCFSLYLCLRGIFGGRPRPIHLVSWISYAFKGF
jgi:hypothetical protein